MKSHKYWSLGALFWYVGMHLFWNQKIYDCA